MSERPGPWGLPPSEAPLLQEAWNHGWTYVDRIGAAEAGLLLSEYYASRHGHSGRALWLERLTAGQIQRNGERLWQDTPLQAGDRLSWQRPPWREPAVPGRWQVVHDDGDLLVLDKPSGLPVLPAGGFLEHTLLRLLERRHRSDPAGVPRPVHRLGRYTSGLLVCARRPGTRARLSQQLRESTAVGSSPPQPDVGEMAGGAAGIGTGAGAGSPCLPPHQQGRADGRATEPASGISDACGASPPTSDTSSDMAGDTAGDRAPGRGVRKLYRALLVPGVLALQPGQTLLIDTPIGRRSHPRLGWIWSAAQDHLHGQPADALPARSTLTLLQRQPQADLVQVAIASGRPHQIRIHCAAVGAPLLGDPLYRPGGLADPQALPGDGGYRLQAWRLALRQPQGDWLQLEVSEPLEIAAAAVAVSGPAALGVG